VWAAIYFNESWTGQEYQAAGHMISEGLVREGMLVTRAVHERYRPAKRNPYNEIECSDHYSRAMASYGVFLEMCGFEYDGPRGHIGFAPRHSAADFAAAFTGAEGWGLYRQTRSGGRQESRIEVRHGTLRVRSIALEVGGRGTAATVKVGGRRVAVSSSQITGGRLELQLAEDVRVAAGTALEVAVR
jgi:hypothetical protein